MIVECKTGALWRVEGCAKGGQLVLLSVGG